MYQNETNDYGCPLLRQRGSMAVQNFDAIIAQLPPSLRAAFEAERAARWLEQASWQAQKSAPAGGRPSALALSASWLRSRRHHAPIGQLLRLASRTGSRIASGPALAIGEYQHWHARRPGVKLMQYFQAAGSIATHAPGFQRLRAAMAGREKAPAALPRFTRRQAAYMYIRFACSRARMIGKSSLARTHQPAAT